MISKDFPKLSNRAVVVVENAMKLDILCSLRPTSTVKMALNMHTKTFQNQSDSVKFTLLGQL